MTKHIGAPIASGVENDVLPDQSCLISAGPSDLVVYAHLAKTIGKTPGVRLMTVARGTHAQPCIR